MSVAPIDNAVAPRRRPWLAFALATVALWGVWGALAGLSAQRGFPDTLVYCVWALTMVPPALFILWRANWRLDRSPRAIAYGMAIGLLGAGGQMLLFKALTIGPAYFIFPIISLSPVITIVLSFALLRERTGWMGALGIVLALSRCRCWIFRSVAATRRDWAGSRWRCSSWPRGACRPTS